MPVKLTQDQQEACDKFLKFLLSEEKEFYLFGSAGCGKTFLIRHFLSDVLNQYRTTCKLFGLSKSSLDIYLTATTNKAAEVLATQLGMQTQTIYSLFDVVVWDDYITGETKLRRTSHKTLSNKLIVIDECSMLGKHMLNIIRNNSNNCKIVFVGDNRQLAPVNEKAHWTNTKEEVTAFLTTPVRNQASPALVNLCNQLRTTVDTGIFKDINLIPGSIELLTFEEARDYMDHFDPKKSKILSFTNELAVQYNDYIFNKKKVNPNKAIGNYYVGTTYVNNSAYSDPQRDKILVNTEDEVYLEKIAPSYLEHLDDGFKFRVHNAYIVCRGKRYRAKLAEDSLTLNKLKKEQKNKKNWHNYFFLKNNVMDLRLSFASTIHKAQGSTYDEVYVDLDSFSNCYNPDVAARLLYVAISRARNKVYLYGSLPQRYGKLV